MSYLVLARKYRPNNFQELSGQEHVTRTLSNAIKRDQVAHAYVLAGPRGVGKTSIARIFAKCLNCQEGSTVTPCLQCTNCREITSGKSLAVREIDGASNNSVDDVRELIESFRTLPAPGSKYKVYIIDEVHMLSLSAFNALLKSLEEPPKNTVFILATTEPHKIPDTVLSRCQRHDLRALPLALIVEGLKEICAKEALEIEPAALNMIARLADGSMRDAQTLLERVRAYSSENISAKDVGEILGTVDQVILRQIAEAIFIKDTAKSITLCNQILDSGTDEGLFVKELVIYFRNLLVAKTCQSIEAASFSITTDEFKDLQEVCKKIQLDDLADLTDMVRVGADRALRSNFTRSAIESLLVRMSLRPNVADMGKIVAKIRGLVSEGQQEKKNVKPSLLTNNYNPVSTEIKQQETLAKDIIKEIKPESFVKFVLENNSPIIAENLKRVSILKFDNEHFQAEGPQFAVSALSKDSKLKDLIIEFSGWSNCNIELKNSYNGSLSAPGSLQSLAEEKIKKIKSERQKKLAAHQSVELVKQIFPGSKVDSIKFKDN